jgi:uncharacterized integral membrane protein
VRCEIAGGGTRLRRMDDPTKQPGDAPQTPAAGEQLAAAAPTPEERLAQRRARRFYAKLILLAALVIYVVAFVIANSGKVKVDFLVHKSHLSLIWLILLCLAIGLVGGMLISQLARRRRARAQAEGDRKSDRR